MSVRTLYRKYLELIQYWPLDPNKSSRDLGVFIRTRIGKNFPKGEQSEINDPLIIKKLQKELEAIERITKNINRDSNPVNNFNTVTGLNAEQLCLVTSSESIKKINDLYDSGFINRMKYRFSLIFSK